MSKFLTKILYVMILLVVFVFLFLIFLTIMQKNSTLTWLVESKINNGVVKISLHFGRVQGMQPGADARAIGGYPGAPQQGGYPPQGGNPYGAPMGGAPGYGSGYPQQGPPGGFGAPMGGAPPGYGSGYPPQGPP